MANQEVRLIAEENYGERPATAMQFQEFTDFSVESTLKRGTPNDANRDRQRRSNPAQKIEVSGSATADAFLQTHLIELASIFCNDWSAAIEVAGADISAVQAGNKLVKPGGWGDIDGEDGFFWVEGFDAADNGTAFLVKVLSAAGDDLLLDPAFATVVDEAGGDPIKVYRTRDIVLGKLTKSFTAEFWNTARGRGFEYNGLGVSSWSIKGSEGIMTMDFSLTGGRKEKRLTARLPNPSTEAPADASFDFLAHLGDPLNTPGSNLGLRYGSQLADLRVDELSLSLENPMLATYGAGPGGNGVNPKDLLLDGELTCKADIKAYRDGGQDAEDLLNAAEDPNAEGDFGYGLRTPYGIRYFYMEAANPGDAKSSDGLKKDGEEMIDNISFHPKKVSDYGYLRLTDIVFPVA